MTATEKLETYLEGWRLGDASRSLGATADGFFYDDPATGRIPREGFVEFFEDFKASGAKLSGGITHSPFLEYSDISVSEGKSNKAWCWWHVTGTDLQGSALIAFSEAGVLSERIAYFSKNPIPTPIPT